MELKKVRKIREPDWVELRKTLRPDRFWLRWNLAYTKRVLAANPRSEMAALLMRAWPMRVQLALSVRYGSKPGAAGTI